MEAAACIQLSRGGLQPRLHEYLGVKMASDSLYLII